ncbi:MAG TPA: hypothetical protein VHN98_08330 [Acidimicrobiales bacterium]|nr:hypothetical protein [Acidimicrobiales bacterium]
MGERETEHGTTTSLEVIDLRGRVQGLRSGSDDDRQRVETVRESNHWEDEFVVEWAVGPRRSS